MLLPTINVSNVYLGLRLKVRLSLGFGGICLTFSTLLLSLNSRLRTYPVSSAMDVLRKRPYFSLIKLSPFSPMLSLTNIIAMSFSSSIEYRLMLSNHVLNDTSDTLYSVLRYWIISIHLLFISFSMAKPAF